MGKRTNRSGIISGLIISDYNSKRKNLFSIASNSGLFALLTKNRLLTPLYCTLAVKNHKRLHAQLSMNRMRHRTFAIMAFTIIVVVLLIFSVKASTIQIDKTAVVLQVIDGSSFKLNSGETVKLASIDIPLSGQPGYSEAQNYLTNIVQGKTVYLTIDNITSPDPYGRLICLAFIDFNSTHYENINMAMIESNYAAPNSSLNGAFNPSSWAWFVPKVVETSPTATSSPGTTPTPTATQYSPPPMPSPSIDVPEIPAFLGLIIVILASTLIIVKFKKKES